MLRGLCGEDVDRANLDECSGRLCCLRFEGCKTIVSRPRNRQGAMLASSSMRAAAQQWSPLVAALVLSGAALFFGGGSGDGSLPWLGGAAIVLALVFAATRPVPGGLLAARAARAARRLVGGVGRVVDRARPELGVREPRARLPRLRARRRVRGRPAEGADVRLRGDPRRGVRLVARRQGAALALRGLRARRPAPRADRLLERARAARGRRAADRPLPRDAAARCRGRCSSTAGSSRSRSPTRAEAWSSPCSSWRRGSRSRAPGPRRSRPSSPRVCRRRS